MHEASACGTARDARPRAACIQGTENRCDVFCGAWGREAGHRLAMRRGRVVAPRCKHLLEEHRRLTKQILAVQGQIDALLLPYDEVHIRMVRDQEGRGGEQVERYEVLDEERCRAVERFIGLLDLMRREHPDLFGYLEEEPL